MNNMCKYGIITIIAIIAVSFIFPLYPVSANGDPDSHLKATVYELSEGSNFAVKDATKADKFFYGDPGIGSMSIDGDIHDITSYNGFAAYSSVGYLKLRFYYDGSYRTEDKDKWNISDSDDKKISGCEVDKIKSGAILVQSSSDGESWEKTYSLSDIFDKNRSELTDFYTIPGNRIADGLMMIR